MSHLSKYYFRGSGPEDFSPSHIKSPLQTWLSIPPELPSQAPSPCIRTLSLFSWIRLCWEPVIIPETTYPSGAELYFPGSPACGFCPIVQFLEGSSNFIVFSSKEVH